MRVLVACEFSGIVRRAFAARGHDAWSCDLLPAEDRSNRHLIGEGQRKGPWLKATPLARVHVFTWRISMPPGELLVAGEVEAKGGKKCFAWFVWEIGWQGPPLVNLLIKPDAKAAE